jgi:hypothetical protein
MPQNTSRINRRRVARIELVACVLAFATPCLPANEVRFGESVVLRGTLRYEIGTLPDGKSVKFHQVDLAKPITVRGNPENVLDHQTEPDTKFVQLVLSETLSKQFQALKGRPVSVSCKLFHSHTGHHFQPVLCDATSIDALPTTKQL